MSRKKLLIIVGGIALILVFIFFLCPPLFPGLCKKPCKKVMVDLEMWGVYDEPEVFNKLIETYEKQNKKCANIRIEYKKINFDNYEEELVNAFASDKAPDIFMIHNTWLPKHKDKISELPEILLPFADFMATFVDVAEQDLTEENKIYGLPFYVDTLALYYNKEYFNTAGISYPPATWDDLILAAEKLTKRNQSGQIERAGITLGTVENINRPTDILSLLMLQNGTEMVSENKDSVNFNKSVRREDTQYYPGQDALRFYTDFANPSKITYAWNRQMPYSIDAFTEGKAAMMINYSHHIATIKSRAPYLNFAVSPMPQLKERNFDVNYANYWAFAVSKRTKLPEEAWNFLIYLTNKENSQGYLENTKKPTARRDLVDWQKEDLELGVFAKQSLTAKSWYQIDNNKVETILANAITSVNLGSSSISRALEIAASQINLLMKKE
jgi:multiple sugar transport system substrate-binding protein